MHNFNHFYLSNHNYPFFHCLDDTSTVVMNMAYEQIQQLHDHSPLPNPLFQFPSVTSNAFSTFSQSTPMPFIISYLSRNPQLQALLAGVVSLFTIISTLAMCVVLMHYGQKYKESVIQFQENLHTELDNWKWSLNWCWEEFWIWRSRLQTANSNSNLQSEVNEEMIRPQINKECLCGKCSRGYFRRR